MWIGGSPNPVTVSAATHRQFPAKRGAKIDATIHADYDAEDLISALVRFDNGAFYSLEGNWCSEVTNYHSFELTTEKGTVTGTPLSVKVDIEGEIVDQAFWEAKKEEWLPSQDDLDYVRSLMTPVYEPGQVANWISAPFKGINGQAADFEYVRF